MAKTLSEWQEEIVKDDCRWCGFSGLKQQQIQWYPHDGGWEVVGFTSFGEYRKQWLYVVCPQCGYEWALWKLGVKRS